MQVAHINDTDGMNMDSDTTDREPQLVIADGVANILLCRPAQHNRIDPDDVAVLKSHLNAIAGRKDIAVLVITGMGNKTFSSGYTLDAIVNRLDRGFEDLLDAIERAPLPTIAAINGSVYGGATDLALCCDFRIGVRGSRMFMPSARLGLHYYPGGIRRYTTILGVAQAKRLFLTAQTIDAEEMLRINFLTELVDPDDLTTRVADYVNDIKSCDAAAVRSMKLEINALGHALPAQTRVAYETSLASPEIPKRLAALRQRRSP